MIQIAGEPPAQIDRSFLDRLAMHASESPERVALFQRVDAGTTVTWTYADLLVRLEHVAAELQSRGVVPGERVGLCLDRSPSTIATMLGILSAGAVFVPLDPEYPAERLQFMVDDSQIKMIVGQPNYRRLFQHESGVGSVPWIDLDELGLLREGEEHWRQSISIANHPEDLAYIMYTSGSTGKPKGVLIEHRALTTYCEADLDCYGKVPTDRTLQFSTLNFDIAIEEIFPPLLGGSSVVVRPLTRADSANELSQIIEDNGITAVHLATAYWHQWVDLLVATQSSVPASLSIVIVTGEKVSVEHYRRWKQVCRHDVRWYNAYGPTETTVTATVFVPPPGWDGDNMPIGKPLKGYEAWILDEELKEVPAGQTGQLYIGGGALARGYLNRPEKTAAAFITRGRRDGSEQRLYRTGDLVRLLPDGNIDFSGRIDHQIKLGSYRIEPGEIEVGLNGITGVRESIVTFDEIDHQKYLIAYVAMSRDSETNSESAQASRLADSLRQRLPKYMIPARYVFLDQLPKTINGKIDRQALPDPRLSIIARGEEFIAPVTFMQREIATIWSKVLHLPEIGLQDDFFLLGGSSLLATQVMTEVRMRFDVELPVRDFFANSTVLTAAAHLEGMLGQREGSVSLAERREARRRGPTIVPLFFPSGQHSLFGVHYQPSTHVASRHHVVLMCHAYGHEYQRAYRNLQQLGLLLANRGFDVFRFDYAGIGNSEGNERDIVCETLATNVVDAAEIARKVSGHQDLSLLGIRLGASLASQTTVAGVNRRILIDPIIDGVAYLQMLEAFHERTLTTRTRFSGIRRRGPIDQTYGIVWSEKKRESFNSIGLSNTRRHSNPPTHCLLSVGSSLGKQSVPDDWAVESVPDEIGWEFPEFAESAFASPAINRRVIELMLGDK